jgi:hypothetical protein
MEPVLPTRAFAGDVPANLTCGFCKRPVQQQFYRTLNRFACGNCAAQVNAVIAKNSVTPASFLAGAGAGLLAALAGGAAWAAVVHVTNFNIGIIAAFIGVGVGKTVHFASGKRRNVSLQWLCVVLSILGVAVGKVGIVCWAIVDQLKNEGAAITVQNIWYGLQQNVNAFKDPFDLVWMGIAAYAAFRLCKPRNISLAGPYTYAPTGSSLQFNTVEPLQSFPPANPTGNP